MGHVMMKSGAEQRIYSKRYEYCAEVTVSSDDKGVVEALYADGKLTVTSKEVEGWREQS